MPSPESSKQNILVTGAGFELLQDEGGSQLLGMLGTRELLERTWTGLNRIDKELDRELVRECDRQKAYPLPMVSSSTKERLPRQVKALKEAARIRDLDTYWNEALALVLEQVLESHHDAESEPRKRKLAASQAEYDVREAFRRALLDYDWGHLNPALDAADLGWTAWLSTNYTGFADRAISAQRGKKKKGWRIVSNSNEAIHLARRLRHGSHDDPVLFKLHGHGEHLLTMAIAGQDKEIYSSLSLPVDSLHEVYSCAETFLKRALRPPSRQPGPIFWHVVGHSLRDVMLNDLMKEALDRDSHVLFVGPDAGAQDEERFVDLNATFHPIRLKAREYMARLKRVGLPPFHIDALPGWIQKIEPEQPTRAAI